MSEAIQSAHVLVFEKSKVLLVKHGEKAGHITGVYGIPGGRPREDELLKKTAKREFQEETGLKVLESDLYSFPHNFYSANIQRKDGKFRRYTMTVFIGKKFSGLPSESEETVPVWVPRDKSNHLDLLPNVQTAIEDGWRFFNEFIK